MTDGTYKQDVDFLKQHTEVIELSGPGSAAMAVAPAYQGRVMTSTLGGEQGAGFGWLNREFIAAGQTHPQFNNYGGEDRFWLGPEAGQFGLFFAPEAAFDFPNWKTPEPFDVQPFDVTSYGDDSVALATQFDVTNYAGEAFCCAVSRTLELLDWDEVAERLGASLPEGVEMVAFESVNTLANAGSRAWSRDSGLLSIWIVGQFKPLPRGRVIVPFCTGEVEQLGPKVTTDYFGPLGEDRCGVQDDYLLFRCDGQYRSKIGISAPRAKSVLGSYDPDANLLTVVQFNLPASAEKLPYVNSLWEIQANPFAGDVVNAYNDGETAPGAGQMGPFYEIETSSPGAELNPGESITHTHRTFHFSGDRDALETLAQRTLGVGLEGIG